ncbi:Lrp/AsnC family transcriptional regulator [Caldicellulosiruptor changbaiensis]|uniref:Lrp/AsnC family transcriptional regulator n=1 Tax=Caldicellulosiruptor changbaiensis TaxID=1222016 RepID=A0A3T0D5I5_9FIRM|nr:MULTISPECIES: Lrp/AsnC family transcriptional regulator [Caldicellulosiruptor]AZT90293.1 Lrp/AsnC family transcriptional regulator [Caldicellulosiruptor changbaiensis]
MNTEIKVLELLEQNPKLSAEEIAIMLNEKKEEIERVIKKLEDEKVIVKYHTIVNWEKTEKEVVEAIIEVKVTPQRGVGYDAIAKRIYKFPEVKAVYLLSGNYDLHVIVEGKTMKDIAHFVGSKLAPLEYVLSTATHFIMKKYKDAGVILEDGEKDDREVITP